MRPFISIVGTLVLLLAVAFLLESPDRAHAARDGAEPEPGVEDLGPPGKDPLRMFDLTVSPDDGVIGDLLDITWKVENTTNKDGLVEMFLVIDDDSQIMERGCGFEMVIPAGNIFWGGVVGEAGLLCEGGPINAVPGSTHLIGVRAVLKDRKGNAKYTAAEDAPFTFVGTDAERP